MLILERVSTTTKQLCLYEVLKMKFENEDANRKKELDLEDRWLKLQERRMDMEEAERKAREEERKAFVESQRRQAVQQRQANEQREEYVQDGNEVYRNLKRWEM